MAFLYKVFSWSEKLKDSQKSAEVVNKTFQAELRNVQSCLEMENDELQMLVDMIYDSSFPETQKFLKDPSKDRLQSHTETISSLLFGLAAQGVAVSPLILSHFQKYGFEAIADTLIKLLELVRPLLASKDAPEFTSDDILDAIDALWQSSVKSSPAIGSLRGSLSSPLQSPRASFSGLSPRGSFSSPRNSFSMQYSKVAGSPGIRISSEIISPRRTQSYSVSPPSPLPGSGWDGAASTPPRRSFSSRILSIDGNLSLPYGERLQPLAEQDEENNHGSARIRKIDDSILASLSRQENDQDIASRPNFETELEQSLDANNSQKSLPLEVSRNSESESAGDTQVVDKQDIPDATCVESTSVPIPQDDGAGGEDNRDNDVRGENTFGASNNVSYDPSTTALDQENTISVVISSHEKEAEEETPEVLVPSSLTGSLGHVQEEGAPGMPSEKTSESEATKELYYEKEPSFDQARTLEITQVQQQTEKLSSPVRKTTEVEQEFSQSEKQIELEHVEDEFCMKDIGEPDNAQINTDEADENTRIVVPEVIGIHNVVVDCVERDIENHEHQSSAPPSSFSDKSDKCSASVIKGKEESSKICLDTAEESLPGKTGTLVEGEMERQEHDSLDLRQGQENMEAVTDILDSSPASDNEETEDSDDEYSGSSSSGSSFSQSSSSSSSSTSDSESSSVSATSSENGASQGNSDDDTDDELCGTPLRQQGTEKVTQSMEDKDCFDDVMVLSHAEDEESTLPVGNGSSELCTNVGEDTNEAPGTEETGSKLCENPELDHEPGAGLLTPSYNSMTFYSDEDRNSGLSVEADGNSSPDEMSEHEVITEPTSHDGLHMILVNYITGSRPNSPKELPIVTNTTANGTYLPSSSSQNHQEVLVEGDVIEVVASSTIVGSTDAGKLSNDALALKQTDGFPLEEMEKNEVLIVNNSATPLIEEKDLKCDQEHMFAGVLLSRESEVVGTDCEGELVGAINKNEMEVQPLTDCESQSMNGDSLSSISPGDEDHDSVFFGKEDLVTGGSDMKELESSEIQSPGTSTGIKDGRTSGGLSDKYITNTGENEPYFVEGENSGQKQDEDVDGNRMVNPQEAASHGIGNRFLDSGCNQQTDPLNGCAVPFCTNVAKHGSSEGVDMEGRLPSKNSAEIDSVALPAYAPKEVDNDSRHLLEESRFAKSRESLPDIVLEQCARVDDTDSVLAALENDVGLLQTEGQKPDISTSITPKSIADDDQNFEASAFQSLSASNEQSEAHECTSHLFGKVEDDELDVFVEPLIVLHAESVADKNGREGFGALQESELEAADSSKMDVSGVSVDSHGSFLSESENPSSLLFDRNNTDAHECVSTQWISSDGKDILSESDKHDPEEGISPRRSILSLSLNEGEISSITEADENHHLEDVGCNLVQSDKTDSDLVQHVEEVESVDSNGGDLKYCEEESLPTVHCEENFVLGDDSPEHSLAESRSSKGSNFEEDDSLHDVNVGQTEPCKVQGRVEVTLPVTDLNDESDLERHTLKSLEASCVGSLPGSLIVGSNDTELSFRVDDDKQFPLSENLDRNKIISEEQTELELIQREPLESISRDSTVITTAVPSYHQLQPDGENLYMICETRNGSTEKENKIDLTPHIDSTLLSEPQELFLADNKGAEFEGIEFTASSNSREEKINSALMHCRNEELEGEKNKISAPETMDALGGADSHEGNNLFIVDLEPAFNPVITETSPSSLEVDDVEQDASLCRVAKDRDPSTISSGIENKCVFAFTCHTPVDSGKSLSEGEIEVPGTGMIVHGMFKQPVTSVSDNNSLPSDIILVEDCKEVTYFEDIEGQEDTNFTKYGAVSQNSQKISDVSDHSEEHARVLQDSGEEERWDEKRPLNLSNTSAMSERLECGSPETTFGTPKTSLGGHDSAAERGEHPSESVSFQKEREMSIMLAEVQKLRKRHLQDGRTEETCKQGNDNQNKRLLGALTTTPANANVRILQNKEQLKRNEGSVLRWPSDLSKVQTQTASQTVGEKTDCDNMEVLAGSFIGSIYNLTFIDSRKDPAGALPAPTAIPSPVKVNSSRTIANLSHSNTMKEQVDYKGTLSPFTDDAMEAKSATQNGSDFDEAVMFSVSSNTTTKAMCMPDTSSLRNSICDSFSSESSFQTEKTVRQRRRFKFVRFFCCSCCSKPVTL